MTLKLKTEGIGRIQMLTYDVSTVLHCKMKSRLKLTHGLSFYRVSTRKNSAVRSFFTFHCGLLILVTSLFSPILAKFNKSLSH